MKGKTTFTLCDAQSGRIIKQIEKHNMVTDAVQNILRFPKYAIARGLSPSAALGSFLPIYKNLMGGLLLFENNIEENAAQCRLPANNRIIGHAGDEYAGTAEMRGTLNRNETYATEDGYHFTWDFATDKANGTIRCASLTHRLFGNIATSEGLGDGTLFINPNIPERTSLVSCVELASCDGEFVGNFKKNIYTFMGLTDNVLWIKNVRALNPDSIGICDTTAQVVESQRTVEIPFVPASGGHNIFVNHAERAVYYFNLEYVSEEATAVKYFSVDPVTAVLLSQGRTVIPKKIAAIQNAAVFGGRLYVMHQYGSAVYTLSGETLRSFEGNTNMSYSCFYEYCGAVYGIVQIGGALMLRNYDADHCPLIRCESTIGCYGTDITYPYSINTNRGGYSVSAYLTMGTSYLATINNLSEPLEKTNSQTLKVTYDITN